MSIASPAENSSKARKREPQGAHDFASTWCVVIELLSRVNNEESFATTQTSSSCSLQLFCTSMSPNAERGRYLWTATNNTKSTTELLMKCFGKYGGASSAGSRRAHCLHLSQAVYRREIGHPTLTNNVFHLLRVKLVTEPDGDYVDVMQELFNVAGGSIELTHADGFVQKHQRYGHVERLVTFRIGFPLQLQKQNSHIVVLIVDNR